ncbi:uncharacterized protein RCO7_14538 [Rhynchosporium graminicola]|uniref:Uncharacterized protein n=1 Tax=Rhynchosporium graminicola TaxID=2792576 RepID=A0A1E1KMN7_9HELO|nr:uncharacterized protein RCO7_14538 [Rhynchosporium commune]
MGISMFRGTRMGGKGVKGKVLRREDFEIYTFRLLLESARVIDDTRHTLGYSGNWSEMEKFDAKHPFPS